MKSMSAFMMALMGILLSTGAVKINDEDNQPSTNKTKSLSTLPLSSNEMGQVEFKLSDLCRMNDSHVPGE